MNASFEIMEKARAVLASAGLVVESVDCSGELVACGTNQKPNGTDGRYKIHMDFPPTVWLCNYHEGGEGQAFPLYDAGTLDAMTEAEKREERERIQRERQAAQERREKARQEAAGEAKIIWARLPYATEQNGYLKRKGVVPLGDMVQGEDGRLVLPVVNGEGETVSLQFIAEDGSKHFLPGGAISGGCFPIPAKDGGEAGPLLIGEGVATVLSCCMTTGFAGLVAFHAGNLEPVARMARTLYPERDVIVCADNDCTDKDGKPRPEEKNTGLVYARKAAQGIGAKLALCPAIRGRKADFNDLFTDTEDGPERVRVCIEKARSEGEASALPQGYFVRESGARAGLYKLEEVGEDCKEYRLGPPLRVLGRTRDEHSKNWGILLEWKDPAGVQHRVALPDELRQKQGKEWAALLAADGYSVEPGMHNRFLGFLSGVKTARFITNTARVGWYQTCFVLPDVSIGAEDGLVVLQSLDCMAGLYQTGGTLEGWQEMARLCVGNHRFAFALCAAFAGPLLKLAGMEGGGFSFEGPSSCGKTTCLQIAASVWGGPSHVRTWRTTSNGLESVASLHNDGLLVLDEVGQATGRDLAEVSYMLANGSGKVRAGRSGGARQSASWRLLFLSSGELGLADKLGEDGLRSKAGQEVRFVGVPVDKGHIEALNGLFSAGALVGSIKEIVSHHYGHASRAFLRWLVREFHAVRDSLPGKVEAIVAELCPEDAGEQVRRVAQRFAVVRIAGDLARAAGVLPASLDSGEAVRVCFGAWLENRGGVGSSEDAAILSAVRLFIEQHGASRFQEVELPGATCINRVGFRRRGEDGTTEYLILPEAFSSEVTKGYSPKRAAEVLRVSGWLRVEREGNKNSIRQTLPGLGRVRVYAVTLPDDAETD